MTEKFIVDYFSPGRPTLGRKFIDILIRIISICIFCVKLLQIYIIHNRNNFDENKCGDKSRKICKLVSKSYSPVVAGKSNTLYNCRHISCYNVICHYYSLDGALKPAILVNMRCQCCQIMCIYHTCTCMKKNYKKINLSPLKVY